METNNEDPMQNINEDLTENIKENKKEDNSYKSILKGTSFMGGVQIFQIVINAIRGKFVAMFLGPAGMGISTLFNNPAQTIQRLSSLGLNLAIVKDVAAAKEREEAMKNLLVTARRLIYSTAILGLIITILLSGWLSEASFGDKSHTFEFILLGSMIFFSVAGSGEMSILQGLHEVKRLSKAAVVGSLTGLFVGVPLYYFFGVDGIVPAMIVLALVTYLFYVYSVGRCVRSGDVKFSIKKHLPLIKSLLAVGFVLMASDLIGSACNYVLNIFVRMEGGLSDVGLFSSANSLTNQYSSIVFAAMAMDYLPRLSASINDNKEMGNIVNRQSEIVSFLIAPIVALLIMFAPIVIKILYTSEFETAIPLLRVMGVGIMFKALSYPMGYITFAKNNKKLFFWLEGIVCNFQTLIFSALFYYFFGLIGLGYGIIADAIICFVIYYFVNKNMYSYTFSPMVVKCFAYCVTAVLLTFIGTYLPMAWGYGFMGVIAAATCFISWKNIRKRWKSA